MQDDVFFIQDGNINHLIFYFFSYSTFFHINICQIKFYNIIILKYQFSKAKIRRTLMPKRQQKRKETPDLQQTQLYDKVTKLQSEILIRLQWLNRKKNIKFDCTHCKQTFDEPYDPKVNYYDKFWKFYCINQVCIQRYKNYKQWIEKVKRKVNEIQKLFKERQQLISPHLSRRKRKFIPMTQQFQCQICQKKYEDEQALNLHISLKHKQQKIKLEAKIQEIDMPYIDYRQGQNFIQNNYQQEDGEEFNEGDKS